MPQLAKKIADNASFQAFINAYLREIDTGVLHTCSSWERETGLTFKQNALHVLELQLPKLHTTLAIGLSYHSLAGRHVVTQVFQTKHNQWSWQPIDYLSTILLLINNIYGTDIESANKNDRKLELLSRTIESQQIMQNYLIERFNDPRLLSPNYIDSEQAILFGHWLHPTPKSRQGIHTWQHKDYTPELGANFQLHYFAINRDLVRQNSILPQSSEDIIQTIIEQAPNKELLSQLSENKQLLPVHPLQAQWLLHQDYIKNLIKAGDLIDVGTMGAAFTPTSSVRTLYCETLDFMIKVSIPVKITNSLRNNMEHELDAGLYVGNLLRNCQFSSQCPNFSTIDDPAYITATLPNMKESGFEVIIRDNPFSQSKSKSLEVQSIAALVQDPLHPDHKSRLATTVIALAKRQNISSAQASILWFEAYFECAIESAIKLYDSYGIALEAHQQNSLLNVTNDIPSHYYYRDNQGFYLSERLRHKLLALEPNLNKTQDLFYDDEMICDRFGYYLFINQLFSVINRFGLDGLISEEELLKIARVKLQLLKIQLTSVGVQFIESVLDRKELPCKGNLLTRVHDVDELQVDQELAVYTHIQNPLFVDVAKTQDADTTQKEVYLESA